MPALPNLTPGIDGSEAAPAEVICVVDDDASVRKSIGFLLKSVGLGVRAFGEPALFLEHLSANQVSVVVLDVWMNRMTGMELLAHLCARSPETRVIFITGHADPAAQATVMAAGAFAFLLKPFDDEDFLAQVRRALRARPATAPSAPSHLRRKSHSPRSNSGAGGFT